MQCVILDFVIAYGFMSVQLITHWTVFKCFYNHCNQRSYTQTKYCYKILLRIRALKWGRKNWLDIAGINARQSLKLLIAGIKVRQNGRVYVALINRGQKFNRHDRLVMVVKVIYSRTIYRNGLNYKYQNKEIEPRYTIQNTQTWNLSYLLLTRNAYIHMHIHEA